MRKIQIALVFCLSIGVAADADSSDGYILTKNQRTLEQIEGVYWEMPAVQYRPPAARWTRLPQTRQRFESGGKLNVVMLGDSIVNDTSRSCWNLLLSVRTRKCRFKKSPPYAAVRDVGGTRNRGEYSSLCWTINRNW